MLRSSVLSYVLVVALSSVVSGSDAPTAEETRPSRRPPAVLAAEVWAIADAVLDHHIDPPTRQQMILDGLHTLYRSADKLPWEAELARRVSELSGPESLIPLLEEVSSLIGMPDEDILLDGLLNGVSGEAYRGLTNEFKVSEQLTANLYVGLQIALAYDKEAGRPKVAEVMSGGPADRAGMRAGDLIEEIDGEPTANKGPLQNVVARLRGPLGSSVVLKLRQPGSQEYRTLTITRGLLPRRSVEAIRKTANEEDDLLLQGPGAIGYIKLLEISGSTPQELRAAARRLEAQGARALVLDLRQARSASLHPAVLLADELLQGGTIGRVRTAARVETFRAEPDALLRDMPMAVLVDDQTSGPTALLDNHRAPLVGSESRRPGVARVPRGALPAQALPRSLRRSDPGDVSTAIPIGDGTRSIKLTTGRLERGDGRALALLPDILAGRQATAESAIDPQVRDDAVLSAAVGFLRQMLELH